jgi:cation transport regulator ChaB
MTLADSTDPVLLFETGLPTRYYLPAEDVNFDILTESSNRSFCPYKGAADRYWDARGDEPVVNVAWSYARPYSAVEKIKDRSPSTTSSSTSPSTGSHSGGPSRSSARSRTGPVAETQPEPKCRHVTARAQASTRHAVRRDVNR